MWTSATSCDLNAFCRRSEVTLGHTRPQGFQFSQIVISTCYKDETENLNKRGTVYHIHCEQCDKEYVDETFRLLETRVMNIFRGIRQRIRQLIRQRNELHYFQNRYVEDTLTIKPVINQANTFLGKLHSCHEDLKFKLSFLLWP